MARNSVVIDLEVRNKQARKALQGVESGFSRLSQKTTQSTKAMETGFNRASQQVRGSMNSVTNLTRIVEDAPFGIRGVANNINPFIESFQRLKTETGSTGSAMKSLLSTAFTGPGALLTITALVTSAITAIQMGLIDWGEEADNTKEQLKSLMDTAQELRDIATGELSLAEANEREISRNERAIELAERRVELERQIALQMQSVGAQEFDQSIGQLQDQTQALDRLIAALGFEATSVQKLESNLRLLRLEQDLLTDGMGEADLKLGAFVNRIQAEAQQTIERYTSGVDGSTDAIKEQISQIESVIGSWTLLARNGQDGLIPIISALRGTVKELNEELGETEKKTSSAFRPLSPQYAMRQQQRRGVNVGPRPDDTILDPGSPFDLPEPPKDWLEEELNKTGQMIDNMEGIKDTGKDSLGQVTMAADLLGNALAQAIVRGEELEGVLKSLAAQLASRAIIRGLSFLLPGGPAIGKTGFFSNFFGFAHGTDAGFPGMGIVGERGPELAVLPPMSSIITNENLEFMQRHQREARAGADGIASINNISVLKAAMKEAIHESLGSAQFDVNLSTNYVDEELGTFQKLKNRIGN